MGKAASIVMRDGPDGHVEMEVVFEGEFDRTSPAHTVIRRLLDHTNQLGMEVKQPPHEPQRIFVAN